MTKEFLRRLVTGTIERLAEKNRDIPEDLLGDLDTLGEYIKSKLPDYISGSQIGNSEYPVIGDGTPDEAYGRLRIYGLTREKMTNLILNKQGSPDLLADKIRKAIFERDIERILSKLNDNL
jgi:hypothetical protein